MEAAANPPPVFSELDDPTFVTDLSSRDLEYGLAPGITILIIPLHFPSKKYQTCEVNISRFPLWHCHSHIKLCAL